MIYRRAWQLLLLKLETQTSWGKEQLKKAMFECLQTAIDHEEDAQ